MNQKLLESVKLALVHEDRPGNRQPDRGGNLSRAGQAGIGAYDPPLSRFWELLAAEENEHYAILQESLTYMDHPGDWFRAKERWIVEGG